MDERRGIPVPEGEVLAELVGAFSAVCVIQLGLLAERGASIPGIVNSLRGAADRAIGVYAIDRALLERIASDFEKIYCRQPHQKERHLVLVKDPPP